jgi:transcriptional regulator with XRE-family HTH domain
MNEENIPSRPARVNESFDSVLAKNLIVARAVRGITQHELSTKSGISRATIAQLESGYSDPRLSTMVLLAEALEVPLMLLLVGTVEAKALAELPQRFQTSPPLDIPPPELQKMQYLVATGMLKDRLRAAQLGAAVAQRLARATVPVFISTAIFSGILPGAGTIVGHALDQLIEEQTR